MRVILLRRTYDIKTGFKKSHYYRQQYKDLNQKLKQAVGLHQHKVVWKILNDAGQYGQLYGNEL